MRSDLRSERGTEVNPAKIGGTTELFGNPDIKTEKPHTIVKFPGGHVEIARTTDNNYWIHVAVEDDALIERARIDANGRYANSTSQILTDELAKADVYHIAFLVKPSEGGFDDA